MGICLLSPFIMFAMFMEPVVYRVFPPTLSELPVAVTVALFVGRAAAHAGWR